MGFCKECGEKADNPALKYCTNCGAALSDEVANTDESKSRASNKTSEKKPMSRKQKRSILIGGAAAVLLIALYFIGSTLTSPERLINNFDDAVSDQDAEELADLITFRGSDEEIDTANAEGFLLYMNENPDISQDVMESLQKQYEMLDGQEQIPSDMEEWMDMLVSSAGNDMILLEKGNGFLFFDTYELTVEPINVTLNANLPETNYFSGDKELGKTAAAEDSQESGPFVPGIHTFRAENENDLSTLRKEEQVTLSNNEELVEFRFDASFITFDPRFDGGEASRIIMNDETYEVNIFEEQFGPVLLDGSTELAVEVDFPWGTMKTKKQIVETEEVPVAFGMSSELQSGLSEALEEHVNLYMNSWKNNDLSKLEGLAPELKKEYEDTITYQHEDDVINEFQYQGMKMATDYLEVSSEKGNYYITVAVDESIHKDKYVDEAYKDPTEITRDFAYDFVYEDGSWRVYNKRPTSLEVEDGSDLGISTDLMTVNGSNTETEEKVASTEVAAGDNEAEVSNTVTAYVEKLVEAINAGDYDIVSPYIKSGSALEEEQTDLVNRLYEDGMTQEVIDVSVSDVTKNGDEWIVATNETIKLTYASGGKEAQDYEWNYTVEAGNDGFVLSEIGE